MRLQRHLSRHVKGKDYVKWVLVVPQDLITKLGWSNKDYLEGEVIGELLTVKKGNPPVKEEKMSYEEFKERIKKVLKSEPNGLLWEEIRKRGNLPQKWPNNRWVRRMDKDLKLIRERVKGRPVWKLG